MKVDILGTGLTAINYDWNNDTIKWSVGSAYGLYGDRVNAYFCMHKDQNIDFKGEVINLDNFPIPEVENKFGKCQFNNSVSFMIAYAILKGATKISLWGIDIEKRSEYEFERPNVLFWIGRAKGLGLEVYSSSYLGESPFSYGYDLDKIDFLVNVLSEKVKAYNRFIEIREGDEKQQFIGASYATQKIIDFLRG